MLEASPAPTPTRPAAPLADAQGRRIEYLRLSLTDRCNFRCGYCSVAEHEEPSQLLSRAELKRLAAILGRLGVRRIRLTGGEPTLRRELVEIARDLSATPGIEELAITTNAHRLAELAGPLRAAGVACVNASLDTLRADRLLAVSGRGARLHAVLAGIEAAAGAGFSELKLNTVVMGGVNDDELGDLTRYAWACGATPRFIELMPFGQGTPVPTARVKTLLEAQGISLAPSARRGWGPAHQMTGHDAAGREHQVGFIGAMTENFCDGCNRARITAQGEFQACLGGEARADLREPLRDGAPEAVIVERVQAALLAKAPRHHMEDAGAGLVRLRPMMGIGG